MISRLREIRDNFFVGMLEAVLGIAVITGCLGYAAAAELAYPSPELCYAIAGAGVAILLGYAVEAVWLASRPERAEMHEHMLGSTCGFGLAGLLGIVAALVTAAHREAGHANLLDHVLLSWSVISLTILGGFITLHPFIVDRLERNQSRRAQ